MFIKFIGRLSSLVGKSSGYIESLPQEVRQRVTALKALQSDHNSIEQEFQREILELEKRYAQRYEPIYQRRKMLIVGEQEPSPEELIKGDEIEKEDGVEAKENAESGEVKGIPQFWLTVLQNHPGIAEVISERDIEALESLVDIKLSYLPQPNSENKQAGFELTFFFNQNDFFENPVLVKRYYYQDEVGYTGEFVYDRAEGCQINWKGEEGEKDLTKRIEVKKQRNKNTNRTRIIKKVVPADSFFNFFNPPKPRKDDEDDEDEDEDEDEIMEELDERLEMDFSLGEELKERVVPRAVDYFTGKALEFTNLDDDEYDDEDDEDEDDEDEDEDGQPQRPQADGNECKNQ